MLNSQMKHSIRRVVLFASTHSQQYRVSGFRFADLSEKAVEQLGCELVDLFEKRFEALRDSVSPPGNHPADSSGEPGDDRPARQRGRGQSR